MAAVKTPKGLVLEFQHSSMPPDERRSREAFYERVTWVVDGTPFNERFHFLDPLPRPGSELAKDIVVFHRRYKRPKFPVMDYPGAFWRRSENSTRSGLHLYHSLDKIKSQILNEHSEHYTFDWIRPHGVWFESDRPVLLDFGEEDLWALRPCVCGDELCGARCVQRYSKQALLAQFGGSPRPLPE